MKKKLGIAALATALSAAMICGTLTVPVYATENEYATCQYCGDEVEMVWRTSMERHEETCKENPNRNFETCKYCGKEITMYWYFDMKDHESLCDKNPNRIKARSSAKEEIEIFIELPE